MNRDRIWELISLKFSGEARPEDLEELDTLLQQHPDEGLRVELLQTIWESRRGNLPINKKEAFNRHLQRLSNHLAEPVLQYETPVLPADRNEAAERSLPGTRSRTIYWATGIAASFLAVFLFFTLADKKSESHPNAQNTVSTKRGSKSKIQLPDGTQVWLNADSRITYNENFQGASREVVLNGEAFFDVVRDETRPFIIHTPTIDVKVLGTAFNVRSYEDEKNTETSLIRGSVEITLVKSSDRKKIILKPNDKLIVNNEDLSLQQPEAVRVQAPVMTLEKISYRKKDSSAIETLWVRNKLAFDDEPLEDIAHKLERWYDVKVTITDEELKKEKFSGIFEDENLQQVLEALRIAGIKSTVNRKEVFLRP